MTEKTDMPQIHDAKTLAEFVDFLKKEQGLSNAALGDRIGLSSATIHRLVHGGNADDGTLDALADYAGITRKWLYNLAKGIDTRPRYSPTISLLAAVLEDEPDDLAQDVLAMARALIKRRKASDKKE